MRHQELCEAIRGTGLEVHQGERMRGGVRYFSVGGERHRLEWVAPGDGEVDFCTTTDTVDGLGWSLRSVKWAVRYVTGALFAWEASHAERQEDLERHEAMTSERGTHGKTKARGRAGPALGSGECRGTSP